MSTDLLVIVDEGSSPFSYSWSGGNTSSPWDVASWVSQSYGGTTRFPRSSATRIGSFTFTFNGTSATFVGNTPESSAAQTATVQIDNGTSFVTNFDDPKPQTYKQWFTTPTLPDGKHTVTMSDLYSISVDYAVVKVGSQTSLAGQTVIVDDDSSLIQYAGQWSRNTNKFIPGTLPKGYPYGNGTHRSSNPGDTFTFRFSGTSIAVYGIFSWYNLGSLTATYSIDGTLYSAASSMNVTTSTRYYLEDVGEASNYLYFNMENLPAGTHTLLVNITEAINQFYILDFITYKPAFDTLSSMPTLSSHAGSTSSSSGSIADHQSISTGAIFGGVLGGLAFGVLATILVISFMLRRRRAREQDCFYQATTLQNSENHPNDPHTLDPPRMQERPTHPNRPAKYAHHESSNSNLATANPHSGIQTSGNLTGVLADPPTYDAISNHSHQP